MFYFIRSSKTHKELCSIEFTILEVDNNSLLSFNSVYSKREFNLLCSKDNITGSISLFNFEKYKYFIKIKITNYMKETLYFQLSYFHKYDYNIINNINYINPGKSKTFFGIENMNNDFTTLRINKYLNDFITKFNFSIINIFDIYIDESDNYTLLNLLQSQITTNSNIYKSAKNKEKFSIDITKNKINDIIFDNNIVLDFSSYETILFKVGTYKYAYAYDTPYGPIFINKLNKLDDMSDKTNLNKMNLFRINNYIYYIAYNEFLDPTAIYLDPANTSVKKLSKLQKYYYTTKDMTKAELEELALLYNIETKTISGDYKEGDITPIKIWSDISKNYDYFLAQITDNRPIFLSSTWETGSDDIFNFTYKTQIIIDNCILQILLTNPHDKLTSISMFIDDLSQSNDNVSFIPYMDTKYIINDDLFNTDLYLKKPTIDYSPTVFKEPLLSDEDSLVRDSISYSPAKAVGGGAFFRVSFGEPLLKPKKTGFIFESKIDYKSTSYLKTTSDLKPTSDYKYISDLKPTSDSPPLISFDTDDTNEINLIDFSKKDDDKYKEFNDLEKQELLILDKIYPTIFNETNSFDSYLRLKKSSKKSDLIYTPVIFSKISSLSKDLKYIHATSKIKKNKTIFAFCIINFKINFFIK